MPLTQSVCIPTRERGNEKKPASPRHEQAGFTLLELLAVITLTAILAGAAIMVYDGVQDQGRDDVTRYEMAQIREALLQFRRDSGTNDFPGQGIYACAELAEDAIDNGGRLDTWPLDITGVTNSNKTSWIEWCEHPANFWMLFTDPLGRSEEDRWDEDRKRGWNGPYLQRKSGLLTLNNPDSIDPKPIAGVWGIADPYLHDASATGISWDAEPYAAMVNGPYLLLGMTTRQNTASITDHHYDDRIVSLGENSIRDEPLPNPDDASDPNPNPCQPHVFDSTGKPLDTILCLLR